jgi:NHLM bacteriocin system ABC transporter ATP-binding protein
MFFARFKEQITSLSELWGFVRTAIEKDGLIMLIVALAGSLLGLVTPIISGMFMDDVIPQADIEFWFEIFMLLLVVTVLSSLLSLIRGIFMVRIELKSGLHLQAALMDHLLRLPVGFFKRYSSGDLSSRALSVNSIQQMLTNSILSSVLTGMFSVVNLVLLFYYDVELAWIGILLSVIAVAYVYIIGLLKLKDNREMAELDGKIQGNLLELLTGISKLRVAGAEIRAFSNWTKRFTRLKKLSFRAGMLQNYVEVFNSSYPLLTSMVFFFFIYYLINSAAQGNTISGFSVGAFLAFISAFRQFLSQCLSLGLTAISTMQIVPLFERIQPIFEEEIESTLENEDPGFLSGHIEMNHLNFRYEENGPLILNDVSFEIKAGELIAFVGPSGSGKSTILRLLIRFEKPESGSIYFNGQDFSVLDVDAVRRQMGVVLQDGTLMSGSIFQNIVGSTNLTLDDAWEAARMCGLDKDIEDMPMGMHTMVSPGGGTFSGGQVQRMMIARAIVHRPKILLFDEATSALDNKTQQIVTDSLDSLQATRIVIAHRLSTIKNADRIYVIDKGSIVETGTYDSLMAEGGIFATLAKRQIA